jgi:hypothetical protein
VIYDPDFPITLPLLKFGEVKVFSFEDENGLNMISPFHGIPLPKTITVAREHSTHNTLKYEADFVDFIFNCVDFDISARKIEAYLTKIIGITPNVMEFLFKPENAERYKIARERRKLRIMEKVETFSDYEDIKPTKESIILAKNIFASRFAVLSRLNKEYSEKKESNVNVSGNLAQVIIAPKEE